MTAAIRAQLLAAGAKIPKEASGVPQERRTPVSHTDVAETKRKAPERPAFPASTAGPETHLIGPYALSLADPKHYPGRSRYVVTGPASSDLTAALVAALTQFTNKS